MIDGALKMGGRCRGVPMAHGANNSEGAFDSHGSAQSNPALEQGTRPTLWKLRTRSYNTRKPK
jgi:hypothetical protein